MTFGTIVRYRYPLLRSPILPSKYSYAPFGSFYFSSSAGDNEKRGVELKPSPGNVRSPLAEMLAKMDINKKSLSSRDRRDSRPIRSDTTDHLLRSESKGFRGRATSAVSILHGDYEDYDDVDKNNKSSEAMVEDEKTSSQANEQNSSDIFQWEEHVRQKKLKWAEQAQPVHREQELDGRGRSYGRGGRKTSTARIFLFPGEGNVTINRIDMVDYFCRKTHRAHILSPFVATKTCGMFDVFCSVEGGGLSGKAGSIRHGIARALEKYNPEFRPPLKLLGYLTRDPRMVERKKSGLKKARKAKQWVKR